MLFPARVVTVVTASAIALLAWSLPALAKPRYYIEVGPIEERPGVQAKIGAQSADLLRQAFKNKSEFAVAEGTFAPPPGTKAYLVKGTVEKLKKTIKPPAAGKRMKMIEVEVKVSLLGTTKPGDSFGFRTDGEAIIGSESENPNDAEVLDVAKDALKEAFAKAVQRTIVELAKPPRRKKR